MKHIKKYSFLIWIFLLGFLYLTVVDSWQVYAKPLRQMEALYERLRTDSVNSGDVGQDFGEDTDSSGAGGDGAGKGEDQNAAETTGAGKGEDQNVAETTGVGEGEDQNVAETTGAGEGENPVPIEPITSREPEDVVYGTVQDDYFADAVFIGDSRTVGLYEYAGMEEISTFYASTGLTVHKVFDSPIVSVPNQKQKQTIEEALQQNSFSKIYLMIGINEMGIGTVDTFIEKYREVVDKLQELQPDAIIYLQGIMKVTTKRSEQGDYITNEGIEARNIEIAKMADNVKIYYLDVNPLICDESGGMEPSYTFDGVHLKAQYIPIWMDFLRSHAVENLCLTDVL